MRFHIDSCLVYLSENVSYPLIGGESGDQCPNKRVKVNFHEDSRIQENISSFSYNVFGFVGFDGMMQTISCLIRSCIDDQCPMTVGGTCDDS